MPLLSRLNQQMKQKKLDAPLCSTTNLQNMNDTDVGMIFFSADQVVLLLLFLPVLVLD